MNYQPMLSYVGKITEVNRQGMIFEPKLDGYRAICYKNSELKLISRNGNDLTGSYPEIDYSGINANDCVLDGEIVVFDDEGKPNFNMLQNHSKEVVYVVFDILRKDGNDLTNLPLKERKKILEDTIEDKPTLQKIYFTSDGENLHDEMKNKGVEGIMAKKEDSLYVQGRRTNNWIKIKFFKTLDCIVLGYKTIKRELSSILLGMYSKDKLVYIGNVGTGFNEQNSKILIDKFSKIPGTALMNIPKIHWLLPELVCEIKYHEITVDRKLRAPVFIRLREDKDPKECVLY